jgi:hypothetical protein
MNDVKIQVLVSPLIAGHQVDLMSNDDGRSPEGHRETIERSPTRGRGESARVADYVQIPGCYRMQLTIHVFVPQLLQIKIYSSHFSVSSLSASPKVSLVFAPDVARVPPHISTAHSFIKPIPRCPLFHLYPDLCARGI